MLTRAAIPDESEFMTAPCVRPSSAHRTTDFINARPSFIATNMEAELKRRCPLGREASATVASCFALKPEIPAPLMSWSDAFLSFPARPEKHREPSIPAKLCNIMGVHPRGIGPKKVFLTNDRAPLHPKEAPRPPLAEAPSRELSRRPLNSAERRAARRLEPSAEAFRAPC